MGCPRCVQFALLRCQIAVLVARRRACGQISSVNDADREENPLAKSTEGQEGIGSGATRVLANQGTNPRPPEGVGGWFRQAQPPEQAPLAGVADGAVAPRS
jgi:hypothetical protein